VVLVNIAHTAGRSASGARSCQAQRSYRERNGLGQMKEGVLGGAEVGLDLTLLHLTDTQIARSCHARGMLLLRGQGGVG